MIGLSIFGLPATTLAAAATLTRREVVVAAVAVIVFLTYLGQVEADNIDSSTSAFVYLYFPTVGSALALMAILVRVVLSVVVKSYDGGKWHEAMNDGPD